MVNALKLSEKDFLTLYPEYQGDVNALGIDLAKMQMWQDFQVEILGGRLLGIVKEHGSNIIEDNYNRGVSRGLGIGGKSISAASRIMKLNSVQEKVLTGAYRVQSALGRFEGDVSTLGGLASYIRSNQNAADWYYSQ